MNEVISQVKLFFIKILNSIFAMQKIKFNYSKLFKRPGGGSKRLQSSTTQVTLRPGFYKHSSQPNSDMAIGYSK
jgi:hypothetical protein